MATGQLLLVILSGLGVVHGLYLSIFLWSYRSGKRLSNRLLSILLLVLSFRIGKSVFLEFTVDLDVKFIFVGLALMTILGPIYFFFAKACLDKSFRFRPILSLHFLPGLLGSVFGIWLNQARVESLPMIVLLMLFIFYYGHFLGYLLITQRLTRSHQGDPDLKASVTMLRLMTGGLFIIWFAYVLNLFDDLIPYVAGPALYSVVVYWISFRMIKAGHLQKIGQEKYKTTPVSDEQVAVVFSKVLEMVDHQKGFLDAELSLKKLSQHLHVSSQVLSMVINKESGLNFNAFVNRYRIEEAKVLLSDRNLMNRTISSIANEVGFNSISSFNAAFKKQTGQTPLDFRADL